MQREAVLSPNLTYRARPTVQVNDQTHRKVTELLQAMQMTEQAGGLSALELQLSNVASDVTGSADLAFEAGTIFTPGAAVTVLAGDESGPTEIFCGLVTAIEVEFSNEAPPQITVLAEDRLQLARLARRTALYTDLSLAELATNVANRIGLRAEISGFRDPLGVQAQLNESDLAFLRRLLARVDGDLQVIGDTLHVAPRSDLGRGQVVLTLGSQLLHARVVADLAHQTTEVTVSGWDAQRGQRVSGSSRGAHLGPGAGRTGAAVLARTLGERSHHISGQAPANEAEATALADAAFDERARRFVCVEASAQGNPALRVGTTVALQGLGPRFDNSYTVVEACHRWDLQTGYTTDFQAECAYWGGN